MKQLLIFGATGGTGKEVVKQSLESGYRVTIIVRNTSEYTLWYPNLKIAEGDVLNLKSFADEVNGKDAVISCLGIGTSTKPTTVYSQGVENILDAMRCVDAKRLICISAGALYINKNIGLLIQAITKLVLQKIFKNLYADMRV